MTIDNSQYTVLVVDDVPVNILLVKGMLAKQKFKVLSATSGQQALEVLTHEHPDCILIASIQNQIKNAESNRKQQETVPTATSNYDGTMRLLAFVACQKQDQFSRMLTEMALCVPIDLVNDDLLNLPDHSPRALVDWTVRRMQNYYVRNAKISVNQTLQDVISLIKPATKARSVSADPLLFRAVVTNLMSYACRMSEGHVQVAAAVDGGLTSIVISTKMEDEDVETTDMRVEIALEIASKMNGAVVCDRDDDGTCQFQILLQI